MLKRGIKLVSYLVLVYQVLHKWLMHSDRSVTGKWVFIVMFEGINIGGSEGAKQVMFCGGQNIFLKVIS